MYLYVRDKSSYPETACQIVMFSQSAFERNLGEFLDICLPTYRPLDAGHLLHKTDW